jgi:tetratricopeptide (TPR) repeat protein
MDADLKKAMALDPNDAETRAALGFYYATINRLSESEREIRLALALNPNDVGVIVAAASTLPYLGHPEEAAQMADRALRLDPYVTPSKLPGIAEAYLYVRRFTDVIAVVERMPPETRPIFTLQILGASYALTGNSQKAQEIAATIKQRTPERTAQAEYANGWYFAHQQEEDLFFESFRVLGLPMCANNEQLTKIKNPRPLPECVVTQVKG